MIRRAATRRHLRRLAAMPPRPAPPEPPSTPLLTVHAGEWARAVEAGNRLITTGQVLRGDERT